MTSLVIVFVLASLFVPSAQGWWLWWWIPEVCYGDLGCFSKTWQFYNSFNYLPRSPETICTKFTLYTRDLTSVIDYQKLQIFVAEKQIKIIVHGYMSSQDERWVQTMVKELLTHNDYYVIAVDWSKGAEVPNYFQAVADTRLVGAEIARLLNALKDSAQILPGNVHIIGHSLGAHIAGYVGEIIPGINRITGMDPAGPAFEFWPKDVRLDKTDANFVDVIHTDAELVYGLGLQRRCGHMDFYPNGGNFQTGCPDEHIDVMEILQFGDIDQIRHIFDLCSHRRVQEYFIVSINSLCQFTSYPCDKIDGQSSVYCNTCGTGCVSMGMHAQPLMTYGKFFLKTNPEEPFCIS